MPFPPHDLAFIALIGLLAGLLGGLLGIGGSVIMIPGLVLLFPAKPPIWQHVFMASAMAVNVAVAAPAAMRHAREGALRPDLFRILLPAAGIAIVVGVFVSDALDPILLRRLFAGFLLYVGIVETRKFFSKEPEFVAGDAKVTVPRGATVGGSMGFVAGLLGVGGGVLAVPLAQQLCRVPLRQAIGASASAMVLTAFVGAALKFSTLHTHDLRALDALLIALALAPTAILGSIVGAGLTHRLPINVVRAALLVIILLAAWRMSGL